VSIGSSGRRLERDTLAGVELATAATIGVAGLAAGAINAVVGSGTLITFPTLIALGYPPVTANVSNNIGLVFGGLSGTWGYRRELEGQRAVVRRLAPMSLLGSIAGALLLLRLPESAFEAVVPVLIGASLVLVVVQPRIAARVAARRAREVAVSGPDLGHGWLPPVGTLLAGVYGGYFGAAQGVLLIGLLGSLLPQSLQRVNALKNLLSVVVNAVAAITFLLVSPQSVDPVVVVLIAVGSVIGGLLGARLGRRLPGWLLRAVIVVVALVAIVRLVTT
jgi:uncharacterized membrane protein YfcA